MNGVHHMLNRTVLLLTLTFVGLSGCTWVKLSEEGERVVVANSVDAACEKVGSTRSIGRSEVARIDRNEEKVALELETLARNHAADMGGNTIVATEAVTDDGKRSYDVYRCP